MEFWGLKQSPFSMGIRGHYAHLSNKKDWGSSKSWQTQQYTSWGEAPQLTSLFPEVSSLNRHLLGILCYLQVYFPTHEIPFGLRGLDN